MQSGPGADSVASRFRPGPASRSSSPPQHGPVFCSFLPIALFAVVVRRPTGRAVHLEWHGPRVGPQHLQPFQQQRLGIRRVAQAGQRRAFGAGGGCRSTVAGTQGRQADRPGFGRRGPGLVESPGVDQQRRSSVRCRDVVCSSPSSLRRICIASRSIGSAVRVVAASICHIAGCPCCGPSTDAPPERAPVHLERLRIISRAPPASPLSCSTNARLFKAARCPGGRRRAACAAWRCLPVHGPLRRISSGRSGCVAMLLRPSAISGCVSPSRTRFICNASRYSASDSRYSPMSLSTTPRLLSASARSVCGSRAVASATQRQGASREGLVVRCPGCGGSGRSLSRLLATSMVLPPRSLRRMASAWRNNGSAACTRPCAPAGLPSWYRLRAMSTCSGPSSFCRSRQRLAIRRLGPVVLRCQRQHSAELFCGLRHLEAVRTVQFKALLQCALSSRTRRGVKRRGSCRPCPWCPSAWPGSPAGGSSGLDARRTLVEDLARSDGVAQRLARDPTP